MMLSSKFNKVKIENSTYSLYYCGNIFINQKLLEDNEIVEYLSLIVDTGNNPNKLENILRSFNNSFAIIYYSDNQLFACVDRLRSCPLFYASIDNNFYISDNYDSLLNMLKTKTLNKEGLLDYFLTGYVTGEETLYNEIHQIQAGEYIFVKIVKDNIHIFKNRYFKFIHKGSRNVYNLYKNFENVLNNTFKRLIKILNGRTAVIPLSGGYDSRLIACLLKESGYDDVICFSYGKYDNSESKISKQVADKLGYKWLFIPYNNAKWYLWYHSKELKDHYNFANFYVSLPHLQDWPAVKEMKERNIIPKDSVFIPGHSLDFLAGSHIPKSWHRRINDIFSVDDTIAGIIKNHYYLFEYPKNNNTLISKIYSRIFYSLSNFKINSINDAISAYEYWDWQERQAKFIVNSVRVYEFWDYEWQIPLWDNEIIDFFSELPLELRIDEFFYKDFLIKALPNFFKDDSKNLSSPNKISKISKLQRQVKTFAKHATENYPILRHYMRRISLIYDYFNQPLAWYGINNLSNHLKKLKIDDFTPTTINSFIIEDVLRNSLTKEFLKIIKNN